ncbi:hypothetical protein R3P38DRAFT_3219415 [Favolaschia claudopus]|uniref:Uncharacterized protein n=1 Tax=Favolaschia claudopus TaxID=2862362 RepID=A0AAW0A2G1_9AGAR
MPPPPNIMPPTSTPPSQPPHFHLVNRALEPRQGSPLDPYFQLLPTSAGQRPVPLPSVGTEISSSSNSSGSSFDAREALPITGRTPALERSTSYFPVFCVVFPVVHYISYADPMLAANVQSYVFQGCNRERSCHIETVEEKDDDVQGQEEDFLDQRKRLLAHPNGDPETSTPYRFLLQDGTAAPPAAAAIVQSVSAGLWFSPKLFPCATCAAYMHPCMREGLTSATSARPNITAVHTPSVEQASTEV